MGVSFNSSLKTEEPVKFDIVDDRKKYEITLKENNEIIDKLTSQIDIENMSTITTFGAEAAQEISKASDVILNNVGKAELDQSNEMFKALAKIMNQFDVKEVSKTGFFEKVFGTTKKNLDKFLSKYKSIGDEVEKIYVQLKQYQADIEKSNQTLDKMFDINVDYYHKLVDYIIAGEQGCKEIRDYLEEKKAEQQKTNDSSLNFEISNLSQALDILEQRVQDLRAAESIAIQSVPMIKTMAYSNYNLVRKIDSAFIVTLPVFKQALAQAVLLKRQKIQADSLAELDKRTNEMLIKNAQNTIEGLKNTTLLASGSSVTTETLETTWKTITDGIAEVQQIKENVAKKREEDKIKLENIKKDYFERVKNESIA